MFYFKSIFDVPGYVYFHTLELILVKLEIYVSGRLQIKSGEVENPVLGKENSEGCGGI